MTCDEITDKIIHFIFWAVSIFVAYLIGHFNGVRDEYEARKDWEGNKQNPN